MTAKREHPLNLQGNTQLDYSPQSHVFKRRRGGYRLSHKISNLMFLFSHCQLLIPLSHRLR